MKKAIIFSVIFCVIIGFSGCGFIGEDGPAIVLSFSPIQPTTSDEVMFTAKAVNNNGLFANAGAKYGASPDPPHIWEVFFYGTDAKPIDSVYDRPNEPGWLTHSIKFNKPGNYGVRIQAFLNIKKTSGGSMDYGDAIFSDIVLVKVSAGQGYKASTISPRFTISEWYPGFIVLNAARTTVEPKIDKVISYEWYIDGINFGSGVEVGTSVTEGSHKVRLEVRTLYGFSQFKEVDYTYKSGAPDVQIDGPSGGVSGGTSGTIDNPPYNPPVDNNPTNPDNTGIGDDAIVSWNMGDEIPAITNSSVTVGCYLEGPPDQVSLKFYTDGSLIDSSSIKIEGVGSWKVVSQGREGSYYKFSATTNNPNLNGGAVVAFRATMRTLSAKKPAALVWIVTDCAAFNSNKRLALTAVDGMVRIN